jgi:23S rRNA pseudouridine1911/1915/1917 synthase
LSCSRRCSCRSGRSGRTRFPTLNRRVPEAAAGGRLDRFLAELPEIGSRSAAERLVEGGAVRVDGRKRPKSYRLEGGEELEVELPPEPSRAIVHEEDVDLPVAYEDDHLLVVDKPAGVVMHPGAGHATGTLVHGLVGRTAGGEEDRPGIVHRLDRDTSGLLVVARSDEAYERLQELVRRRELERNYVALVRGHPRSWQGRIDAPIGRDRTDPTRRSLDTDSPREAVTHFEVAELIDGHALLNVRLDTGRTHQIRVHLAAIDLPVIGDRVYGVSDKSLDRQFLHAGRLAFEHPFTGARVDVESPLPPDLERYLSRLRRTG